MGVREFIAAVDRIRARARSRLGSKAPDAARRADVAARIGRGRAIGYDTKTMDDMQDAGGWPGTR